MRSFAIPIFMNALSSVLLLSLVDNALSAAIAAQPGYLPHSHNPHRHHHHHHNHIRPAHININDLENNNHNQNKNNNGHPSMPSVSSRIFTYGKLADKYIMVNDAYLKDGWQSRLEVANAEAEAGAHSGDGSGSPSLRLVGALDGDSNAATIKTVIAGPPTQTQGEGAYQKSSHPYDEEEYYHIQPHLKVSTTAQESESAGVHPVESGTVSSLGRLSPPAPTLPHHHHHHQACKTVLKKIRGGLASRLSSYASTIQRGLVGFVNVRLSVFGAELRRTELPSGQEELSLVLEDFLWA